MSSQSKTLSWNDRMAIIEHFNPSDEEIIAKMGVTKEDLSSARDLRTTGLIVPTPNLDFNSYSSMFGGNTKSIIRPSNTKPTAAAPQTSTQAIKAPKKRGRKGDKIAIAFSAIPTKPTSAQKFAVDNNISLSVLRQSKRFDSSPQLGNVRVKKDKRTKELMVWREPVSS